MRLFLFILFILPLNAFATGEWFLQYNKGKCVPTRTVFDLEPGNTYRGQAFESLLLDEDKRGENWTMDSTLEKEGIYYFRDLNSNKAITLADTQEKCEKILVITAAKIQKGTE